MAGFAGFFMILTALIYGCLEFGWGGFLVFVLTGAGIGLLEHQLLEYQDDYDKMENKLQEQNRKGEK